MLEKFILNHQYNFIKKQVEMLKQNINQNIDNDVLANIREMSLNKVVSQFSNLNEEQYRLLSEINKIKTELEFDEYIKRIYDYTKHFPYLSEVKLRKLFKNVKKLNIPRNIFNEDKPLTYVSWNDLGSFRKFFIYQFNNKIVGFQSRITLCNKKGYCAFCNSFEELVLISSNSKHNNQTSYYKAFGHYVCLDSERCNKNITDTKQLDEFVRKLYLTRGAR
ncbi:MULTISPECIES: FusB/FusC family EF-G-binding protein [Geobacillus]|uniref:Fibronectin-binding protein n=1 Tax=Geobacillus thermopakistaniensis (strain MAS1) TaxID=1408282 RepID=A0A7U9JDQ6_GEOTM|nr:MULTISPECIES: elongation factor G-binding protein [unclassified Geobacillus]ADU94730.1 Fibronectin-binding family protein [Geobacillus sp. Y412MC52]ESU73700.1 fibronectin-binding protein [Geobacillus sp. MAS1]